MAISKPGAQIRLPFGDAMQHGYMAKVLYLR